MKTTTRVTLGGSVRGLAVRLDGRTANLCCVAPGRATASGAVSPATTFHPDVGRSPITRRVWTAWIRTARSLILTWAALRLMNLANALLRRADR